MKARFVDTNVFLEALVRSGEKSDLCIKLLTNEKIQLWTTELVVVEVEWVMRSGYDVPKEKIVEALKRILNLSSLRVKNQKELLTAIELFEAVNIDFTDCLNVAIMSEQKIHEVCSYDHDFDKIKSLKRIEP